ncbi:hypothetical protein KQX54_004259 [Cotesia glomerata]|uniref:Uncharacterized protein n=1 Tax=Cotesia glomerata TaxID=32391 RepID=A0AAV7I9D3_COTGL|nr:hypothetical protein KQX54_004259 [Cotesia glomerata]
MLYDPHGFTLNLTPLFVRLWERGPQAEAEAQGRPIMQIGTEDATSMAHLEEKVRVAEQRLCAVASRPLPVAGSTHFYINHVLVRYPEPEPGIFRRGIEN